MVVNGGQARCGQIADRGAGREKAPPSGIGEGHPHTKHACEIFKKVLREILIKSESSFTPKP